MGYFANVWDGIRTTAQGFKITLGYLKVRGFWGVLGLTLIESATLAPMTILADALALGSASLPKDSGRRGFEYGWVRGAGSAAFVAGTLVAGHAVAGLGLGAIIVLESTLLAIAVPAAMCVPEVVHRRSERDSPAPARAFLAAQHCPYSSANSTASSLGRNTKMPYRRRDSCFPQLLRLLQARGTPQLWKECRRAPRCRTHAGAPRAASPR